MLKRIVVIGGDARLCEAMIKEAAGKDVQILPLEPGAEIPTATVGIVAAPEHASAALEAALRMGAQLEEMLRIISDAIDAREGLAPGSSMRLKETATRFAHVVNLTPEDQLTLERGTLLRDVGKTRIANEVLLKAGVLNYDEWSLLQQHPHLGAEIVSQSPLFRDTAGIVRSHHESYDGYGYPDGLEGEAIPYLARVLKILDVFCAMTSPRLYRKGQSSAEDAYDYLRGEKGKHFDPALVDIFIDSKIGQVAAEKG